MCLNGKNLINDIPFMLFMEEQEKKEKERQQLAKEDTNRRDREQSEDNPYKII